MPTVTIEHNAEKFAEHLAFHLAEPERGGVMAAVDVVSSDARPGRLLLVVHDAMRPFERWYSDQIFYTRYQDAFAALGAHLDEVNPFFAPLSDRWQE